MRSPVLGLGGVLHREIVRFLNTLRGLLSRTSQQVGAVEVAAEDATIATTAIDTPTLQNALYQATYSLRIVTPGTVSSSATLTLGWTTNSVSCSQAFTALTGNTTATQQSGMAVMFPDAATSVTYALAYASVGATAMTYDLDIRLDVLP